MRRFLALAMAVVLSLLPITPVKAATYHTYYVATNGNDSYPGTQTQPWKTITQAAKTAVAGDTVIITPGTYSESVAFQKSGTSSAPVTFQGQSAPVIVPATQTSTPMCLDSRNSCVRGTLKIDGNYVVLKNFEVVGPPSDPGDEAGISVNGSYNQVANNFIHNTYKEGVTVWDTSTYTRVLNNYITYAVVSGIKFDGSYHRIQGNTITHTVTRAPDGQAPASGTDPDGIRFFGAGSFVLDNVIKDIYVDESPQSDYPHSDCFQTWRDTTHITFEGNYCELENSSSSDSMVKFFMIERPTSSTVGDITIINNIFVSKSTSQLWTPIQVGNDSCSTSYPLSGITIANNTFVHPGNVAAFTAILIRCSSDILISNNSFYNFGNESSRYILQDKGNNVNVTISNNAVYSSTGEIPEDGPYPGDDIASIWMKNPLFVNVSGGDYHLQASSPLIDAGKNLEGIVDQDYAEVARPEGSGYDIGAYEFRRPIAISGNVGESGVTLTYYDGSTKKITSDASGNYSFMVPYKWSGTITPTRTYYTFFPQNLKFAGLITNQTSQDFTFEISSFADVPTTYWAWQQIENFYSAGITVGCGINPTIFCPNRSVTRAEMAVFVLRAKNGTSTPNPEATDIFSDVPVEGKEWMQPWIEQYYLEGITVGCNDEPISYCPEKQTTRAEMAVFILRAIHGIGYAPPDPTGIFDDVPVAGKEWMQPWIEEFFREGLTTGCTADSTKYCPEKPVTRAEMAVFIDRAFNN